MQSLSMRIEMLRLYFAGLLLSRERSDLQSVSFDERFSSKEADDNISLV